MGDIKGDLHGKLRLGLDMSPDARSKGRTFKFPGTIAKPSLTTSAFTLGIFELRFPASELGQQ